MLEVPIKKKKVITHRIRVQFNCHQMAVAGMKCINVWATKVCLQIHKSPRKMKHHRSMPPNNLYFLFNFFWKIQLHWASWQQLKLSTSLLYLFKTRLQIAAKDIYFLLLYSDIHKYFLFKYQYWWCEIPKRDRLSLWCGQTIKANKNWDFRKKTIFRVECIQKEPCLVA